MAPVKTRCGLFCSLEKSNAGEYNIIHAWIPDILETYASEKMKKVN